MRNHDQETAALLKRLALLPTKAARILQSLLEVGHIDHAILNTVLDAGDLSGETHRLSAFTTSYLFLRSKDVPVADVIYMAKQHGRKVNLRWSAKRWKLEHDRLSRYETLTKLAENNQVYDVSEFAQRLPASFPGYLIRTSRRLGMEGLRQRHCVASYHDRISDQQLAVCVVFIDSVRWTVELRLTESEDYPLTIQAIRSKLNQLPSMTVKNRIHEVLGIQRFEDSKRLATPRQDDCPQWYDNLAVVIEAARAAGISSAVVNFDGSGDSGSIENVSFFNRVMTENGERRTVADVTQIDPLRIQHMVSHFEQGHWIRQSNWKEVSLTEACEQICDDYLETTGIDWYNDDGGFGEMTIDFIAEEITMEVNVRYTESINEFDETTSFEELLGTDADKAA